MRNTTTFTERGALSLREFLVWASIGRTKALQDIEAGRLTAVMSAVAYLSRPQPPSIGLPLSRMRARDERFQHTWTKTE